jgi:hypothetical protein
MAYIVYQKTGTLADAAKQYNELRIAGKRDEAIALYRKVTGDTRAMGNEYGTLPTADSCWWIYNADGVIRRWHGLTEADYDKVYREHSSEEARAQAVCNLAQHKVGGTWDYYYEY